MLKECFLMKIFFVLQCHPEIVFGENKETIPGTISIQNAVNQELISFIELLERFKNAPNDEAGEFLRGRIIGKLESKLEDKIKAENKVEGMLRELGALETYKERSDIYRVLLGIGHRIDDLEEILTAGSDVKLVKRPRDTRWKDILKLKTLQVQELRKKISNAGLTNDLFAACVQKICQERNERAGHGDVSLPEVLKDNNLEEVVRMMKIPKHDSYKRTIQILISPLTLPSTTNPESANLK